MSDEERADRILREECEAAARAHKDWRQAQMDALLRMAREVREDMSEHHDRCDKASKMASAYTPCTCGAFSLAAIAQRLHMARRATLDELALKAPPPPHDWHGAYTSELRDARWRYAWAEAMLAESEKRA